MLHTEQDGACWEDGKKCRLCGGDVTLVAPMAAMPPVDKFTVEPVDVALTPADIYLCNSCGHAQLCDVIPPDDLYRDYLFRTGDDPALVEHFKLYAMYCQKRYPANMVMEIGSNDGTLLEFFQKRGSKVLGIDPNNVEKKVRTENCFFTYEKAKELRLTYGLADLILANHVFAHMDDISDVVKGVRHLLEPTGVFVFEAMYLLDLIDKRYYDTVFHEHLSYHSIASLSPFFARHGLDLFDVQHNDCKGGSIRGFVQHQGGKYEGKIPAERMVNAQSFDGFNAELQELRGKVAGVRHAIGYGASASGTAMMYHLGLQDKIQFIVDDSERRIGRYSPGAKLEVKPSRSIYDSDLPIVILAPRYTKEIKARHPTIADRFI